jgi:uncharacterized membrane protein
MKMRGYLLYMILVVLLTVPVFLVPVLAAGNPSLFATAQSIYQPTCHQLTERSLCWYPSKMSFGDCLKSDKLVLDKSEVVITDGAIGYKMPVCARDVGIYLFMLLGGVMLYVRGNHDSQTIPAAIWLILALVPIGIDGGGQFIGLWESSNSMRLFTGAIAGFALPFYMVPMLNRLLDKSSKLPKKTKVEKV